MPKPKPTCQLHPDYAPKFFPKTDCRACWEMFKKKHGARIANLYRDRNGLPRV